MVKKDIRNNKTKQKVGLKVVDRACDQCGEEIPPKRLELVPNAELCVKCQSKKDVFKYRMKTVGFNDTPTIAKNEEDWKLLEKQTQLKDI